MDQITNLRELVQDCRVRINKYVYTPHAPRLDAGWRSYTGGEAGAAGESIYPAAGCNISVRRHVDRADATVNVHTWTDTTGTSLEIRLGANDLVRLAHRLLDAAADLEASVAMEREVAA